VELPEDEIASLTFDELARDRARLLGLRSPSDLRALLGASKT
jgi:hypothetical protein